MIYSRRTDKIPNEKWAGHYILSFLTADGKIGRCSDGSVSGGAFVEIENL